MVQFTSTIGFVIRVLWLVPILSLQKETKLITDVRIQIVDQTLFVYWTVNPDWGGSSDVTQLSVKYCPVDRAHVATSQNCQINVTICEVNYTSLNSSPSPIITHQDLLADYLNKSDTRDYFFTRDIPVRLSSEWNRKKRQFMCAIHNLKKCYYNDGWKLGDLLVTASENFTKLKEIQPPVYYLVKPENISVIQNGSSVTIQWYNYYECWRYFAPNDYYVLLESNEKDLKYQAIVSTVGRRANTAWEHTFRGVKPFTVYTVKVHGVIIRGPIHGPMAQKTFKTKEDAPSSAPLILCSMCSTRKFEDYREVEIRWKLPPRETWNGIIRLAVVTYGTESPNDYAASLEFRGPNLTYAILPKLKQNTQYWFKIKICTLEVLCSHYSQLGYIAPDVETSPSKNKGNRNKLVIGLVVGFVAAIALIVILITWHCKKHGYGCFNMKSELENYQLSEDHILQNGLSKDRDSTIVSDVYNYLPEQNE